MYKEFFRICKVLLNDLMLPFRPHPQSFGHKATLTRPLAWALRAATVRPNKQYHSDPYKSINALKIISLTKCAFVLVGDMNVGRCESVRVTE